MTRTISRMLCIVCLGAAIACQGQTSNSTNNGITLAGTGYTALNAGLAVAPGQIITLHVYGLTVTTPVNVMGTGLALTLNGISVALIQGMPAVTTGLEIHAIYQTLCSQPAACSNLTGITLQIPFNLDVNPNLSDGLFPVLEISQNGTAVGGVVLEPVDDEVHVLNTCDDTQVYISAAYEIPQGICASLVMVNQQLNSLYNLAHGGDELMVWLYGLGAITQAAPNCCSTPNQLSQPLAHFQLNFDFRPNAPASPAVAGFGLTARPAFVAYTGGTYQLNFVIPPVPAGVPACDGVKIQANLTVTVSGPNSYDAAQICVSPN